MGTLAWQLYPAAEVCEDCIPGLRVDHLDVADLPMLNTDLETNGGTGFPPAVEAFRAKVRHADCFLFASPEYNYSITSECFAYYTVYFVVLHASPTSTAGH